MSIATEIQRLQTAKANIKTSIENKGVSVSAEATLDDYPDYIDAINISTQEKTITPQNYTHEITADSGYRGLSKVILDGILVDAHDSYTTDTDSTTAYQKTVPSGALKYANLDKLGFMSYKSKNKCVSILADTTWDFWLRFYAKPNTTYYAKVFNNSINSPRDAKIGLVFDENKYSYVETYYVDNYTHTLTTGFSFTTGNISEGYYKLRFQYNSQSNFTGDGMIVEGSTAPTTYQPYFTDIRDSAVTSVVSKDSNDTTIDTYSIPAAIQALTGYGWGVNDTCYNYIDFETKKFNKKVGRVVLDGSNDEEWEKVGSTYFNVNNIILGSTYSSGEIDNSLMGNNDYQHITAYYLSNANFQSATSSIDLCWQKHNEGKGFRFKNKNYSTLDAWKTYLQSNPITIYYELATPVETDISQYLDDNFIEVEPNGTITFNNTYNQAVPSEVTYLVEV